MSSQHFTAEGLLKAPPRPAHLPPEAQWLAGTGAGSWFVIKPLPPQLYAARYNQDGKLECEGTFAPACNTYRINWDAPLRVHYLSHCAQVSLRQNEKQFLFLKTITFQKPELQK